MNDFVAAPLLLIKIIRHALPRSTLGRADIARRRGQNVLPRLPLDFAWHAIQRTLEAGLGVAAARSQFAAALERTVTPQFESIAIAALLQRRLGLKPRVVVVGFH